jgi:hypothetical protein
MAVVTHMCEIVVMLVNTLMFVKPVNELVFSVKPFTCRKVTGSSVTKSVSANGFADIAMD